MTDRFSNKEMEERLGIEDKAFVLHQNRLHGVGMCCEKKMMTGEKKCTDPPFGTVCRTM